MSCDTSGNTMRNASLTVGLSALLVFTPAAPLVPFILMQGIPSAIGESKREKEAIEKAKQTCESLKKTTETTDEMAAMLVELKNTEKISKDNHDRLLVMSDNMVSWKDELADERKSFQTKKMIYIIINIVTVVFLIIIINDKHSKKVKTLSKIAKAAGVNLNN